jgi:phosphatidylglycerophosphate synthase
VKDTIFNVPNCISILRIMMIPVLLLLAWQRHAIFTALLTTVLLMDILDGYLARRLNQQTRLGAQLDSWGDFLTVLVYPFAGVWLRPEATRALVPYAVLAGIAYLSPIIFGFIKFGRLTSYHTRLMTIAAYVMGAAMISFFAGWSDLPFRLGCLILLVAQIEEILISAVLPSWRENIPGFRCALQLRSAWRSTQR